MGVGSSIMHNEKIGMKKTKVSMAIILRKIFGGLLFLLFTFSLIFTIFQIFFQLLFGKKKKLFFLRSSGFDTSIVYQPKFFLSG